MNVIQSIWAFKLKRFPDGLIKKFNARFCARGDQQLEGIYLLVAKWSRVRNSFLGPQVRNLPRRYVYYLLCLSQKTLAN